MGACFRNAALVVSYDFKGHIFQHGPKHCFVYVYQEFSQRVRKETQYEVTNLSRKTNTGKNICKVFQTNIPLFVDPSVPHPRETCFTSGQYFTSSASLVCVYIDSYYSCCCYICYNSAYVPSPQTTASWC